MSRAVRKVPADWQHPKRSDGLFQPMFDRDYRLACAEWKDGYEEWKRDPQKDCEFWDWDGPPPDQKYYRPPWTEEERSHYQMYETTSEGTPISPVMETPEELARWLADNEASAFAERRATYEEWLRVCLGGYAPSMMVTEKGLQSGVEGLTPQPGETGI